MFCVFKFFFDVSRNSLHFHETATMPHVEPDVKLLVIGTAGVRKQDTHRVSANVETAMFLTY